MPGASPPQVSKGDSSSETSGGRGENKGARATADLLASQGVELWVSQDEDEPCATFIEAGRRVSAPIESKLLRRYATRLRNQHMRLGMTDAVWTELRALLEADAYEGAKRPTGRRMKWTFEGRVSTVWINLTDRTGRVVRVDPNGWRVIPPEDSPVRFFDPPHAEPFPMPERGGDETTLARFVNLPPDRLPLFWGAIAACYVPPPAAFPVINFFGEEDSGKTTALKVLRSLVDPVQGAARQAPRNKEGLIAAMKNNHLITCENASRLSQELSDALSTLSTGGGIADRAKYTNGEEYVAHGRRPVILCGIPDVARSADLRSRMTPIPFPSLPLGGRRGETDFWGEFEYERPRLFGLVLDRIARALANFPTTEIDSGLRMSDAARWVQAGEPEETRGSYVALLEVALSKARGEYIESNLLASALARFARDEGPIRIGATDLHTTLTIREREGSDGPLKDWPENPRAFGHAIRRVAPMLRAEGYGIDKEDGDLCTFYTLRPKPNQRTDATVTGNNPKAGDP